MNEARAIKLCVKHRDPVGFEYLVRRYQRQAYSHAAVLLGNRDAAADACQESFARAFASLSRLDGRATRPVRSLSKISGDVSKPPSSSCGADMRTGP